MPAPVEAPLPASGRRSRSRSVRFTPFAAPRTPAEETLAAIFREVLDVDEAGVHDSFFELGGHSLLGTVLMSRVQDAFGRDLPLLRLFETPTVAGLALLLAEEAGGEADRIVRVAPFEDGLAAHPLSFPQQGLWFLDQLEPGLTARSAPRRRRRGSPWAWCYRIAARSRAAPW